jgi:hypothetical protein
MRPACQRAGPFTRIRGALQGGAARALATAASSRCSRAVASPPRSIATRERSGRTCALPVSSRAATRSLCHGLIGVEQLRRRMTRIDRRGHVAPPRAKNHAGPPASSRRTSGVPQPPTTTSCARPSNRSRATVSAARSTATHGLSTCDTQARCYTAAPAPVRGYVRRRTLRDVRAACTRAPDPPLTSEDYRTSWAPTLVRLESGRRPALARMTACRPLRAPSGSWSRVPPAGDRSSAPSWELPRLATVELHGRQR